LTENKIGKKSEIVAYQLDSIEEGRPAGTRLKLVLGWEEINVAAHTLVHTYFTKEFCFQTKLRKNVTRIYRPDHQYCFTFNNF
jgi:hypothetical protein